MDFDDEDRIGERYYQEHIIVYISPQWVIARSL